MSVGAVHEATSQDLGRFYDFLYGVREGWVYAALKIAKENELSLFKQYFFKWPIQRDDIINFTLSSRSRGDVYMAPALFKAAFGEGDAHESFVQDSDVVWVELDDPPARLDNVPPPSCRIASGGEGHEHWYWKIDRPLTVEQIRLINSALTHHMDADPSGIDAGQILRPPGTYNFKRKRETSVVEFSGAVLSLDMFSSIPPPPPKPNPALAEVSYIPPINEVLAKYTFPQTVLQLFNYSRPDDRSDALMALGYHCAEMGMAQPEILAMLVNADDRWQKFLGRDDRMQRLIEIVALAIQKYPDRNGAEAVLVDLTPMGFRTLLNTEVKLEWQWDGFLQKNGYFLLTGPTGVGKTQFSLSAAGHMALGKPFLGRDMRPARIGFFSLEMGITDLKYFLTQLQHTFTLQEQDVLEEQLLFFPLGEPLYMSNDIVKGQLDQVVGDLKLDGIMVDSLGSATDEGLQDESFRKFFHWNDKFRQRHDIFTWYIHHHRKANGQNRKPKRIEDVYGSQYITSYATSVVCLWGSEALPNVLEHISLKKRLAPKDAPFFIQRNERLDFEIIQPNSASKLGPAALLPQATGPVPGSPPALPGPQAATQGLSAGPSGRTSPPTSAEAIRSGNWSTGPKSFADMADGDFSINLNMRDSK